jgi:hypothetical protein
VGLLPHTARIQGGWAASGPHSSLRFFEDSFLFDSYSATAHMDGGCAGELGLLHEAIQAMYDWLIPLAVDSTWFEHYVLRDGLRRWSVHSCWHLLLQEGYDEVDELKRC